MEAERVRTSFARQGAMATLGAALVDIGSGRVAIALLIEPRLSQQDGFLHAGVVVAVLDSNSDPRKVKFPFPGNDDASRAINLYCDLVVAAVLDGIQAEMSASGIDVGEIEDLGEIEELPAPGAEEMPVAAEEPAAAKVPRPAPRSERACELFRQGAAIEDVMHQLQRARSTVCDYLCDYIRRERPQSLAAWVPDDVFQRVAAAARQVGTERLKPIFVALGEQIPYDTIRLVVTHLTASQADC